MVVSYNFLSIGRSLDLSFNRLTKIENLGSLTRLRKLFLIHNKISKIENIGHLVNLEMLELGSNRIRVGLTVYVPETKIAEFAKCRSL